MKLKYGSVDLLISLATSKKKFDFSAGFYFTEMISTNSWCSRPSRLEGHPSSFCAHVALSIAKKRPVMPAKHLPCRVHLVPFCCPAVCLIPVLLLLHGNKMLTTTSLFVQVVHNSLFYLKPHKFRAAWSTVVACVISICAA